MKNLKSDFPIFEYFEKQGNPLLYLDSAATAQMPWVVSDAVCDFSLRSRANIHRGIYGLSETATEAYEQARDVVQKFINARSRNEIIFTRNTTESINLVAYSLGKRILKSGDHVLTSIAEHHSNFLPWQMLRDERGIVLDIVDIDSEGKLRVDEVEKKIHPNTKLAAFAHVSHVLGTINPIEDTAKLFRDRGIMFLVDAAQSAAHLPIDVQKIGCDFLAFSGHKIGSPMGIGVLYAREEVLKKLPPFLRGGGIVHEVAQEETTWHKEPPLRFEAGTPNVEGAVGLVAAIQYIQSIGFDVIQKHETALLEKALAELKKISGMRIWGPKSVSDRSGLVSFTIEGVHPHDLATILDRDNVCIRAGHHCAMPLHQKFGVSATSRASFWIYNTPEDVDPLINGIKKAVHVLKM